MEVEEQERVKVAVEEVLANAKFDQVTTRKVRELAEEKTGIDLSQSRHWKQFVSDVIAEFVDTKFPKRSEAEDLEPSPEEEKPTAVRKASRDGSSKEKMEDIEEQDVSEEEYEDDEEEVRGGGKRPKYEKDAEGNYIICELSTKRKVVVSQWKGKTLISLREYYEKDGKVLPSSKGISLTAEQFQVLAKATKDVDRAISSIE